MPGVLALLVAEREERLETGTSGKPRKTELILATSGLNPQEIATLLGKNVDAIGRASSGGGSDEAPPRKSARTSVVSEVEPRGVDELTRVISLALRYQGIPQGVLVHDLSDAGVPVGRIAILLNTTNNTVSQQKSKKRPAGPKKD